MLLLLPLLWINQFKVVTILIEFSYFNMLSPSIHAMHPLVDA